MPMTEMIAFNENDGLPNGRLKYYNEDYIF